MHVTATDEPCRNGVDSPPPSSVTRVLSPARVTSLEDTSSVHTEPPFSAQPNTPGANVTASSKPPCPRTVEAWRAWLGALASDAEAALAAAMAYEQLDAAGREAWLESLAHDAEALGVPKIAVYAPLLAVESDAARRERIATAIGPEHLSAAPRQSPWALMGLGPRCLKVAVLVSPLYMDFVQVLACGYRVGQQFEWVRHDPIVSSAAALRPGALVGGVVVESTPLKGVVDELALTIVAHRRHSGELPEALRAFAHVFKPVFEG